MLYSNFVSSLLFFFTAFFIMLVLQVNHSLIVRLTMRTLELKDFSEQLLKETQSLSSAKDKLENIKGLLEKKNSDMGNALKKWSDWRISIMNKMTSEQPKQQTQTVEQKTEPDQNK